MEDEESAALAARTSLSLLLASIAAVEPLAGPALAAAMPGLDVAIKRWQNSLAQRAGRALSVGVETSGLPTDEVVARLTTDPLRLALLGESLSAASRTALDEKVAALGRCLASGVLASDDAKVDDERLWVKILDELEAPHVRLLDSIEREGAGRYRDVVRGLDREGDASEHLLAVLMRLGLVKEHVTYFTRFSGGKELPLTAGQVASDGHTSWRITATGTAALNRLRAVGDSTTERTDQGP